MRLVDIPTFQSAFDPRCTPQAATVKRWIENGEVPGRRVGRKYYIDLDAFNDEPDDRSADDLVNAVLNHG